MGKATVAKEAHEKARKWRHWPICCYSINFGTVERHMVSVSVNTTAAHNSETKPSVKCTGIGRQSSGWWGPENGQLVGTRSMGEDQRNPGEASW